MKLFAMVLALCATSTAHASASIDLVSEYYWRGLVVPGPSLQPSVSLDLTDNLSVSAWGAFNLDDRNQYDSSDEVDFTLAYFVSNENYDVELGIMQYVLPNSQTVSVSTESFVTLSLNNLPVTPSVSNYLALDGGNGWYIDTALSREIGDLMTHRGTMSLEVHFAVDIQGRTAVKPSDAWASLAVTTTLGSWIVTPSVNYGYTLNDNKVALNGGDEFTFWAGLSLE